MTTPFLGIDELDDNQNQAHLKVNFARATLEAATSIEVLDKDLANPPTSPLDTDRYIVPNGASGVWVGQGSKVAYLVGGAWYFLTPRTGWLVYVVDEAQYYEWDGAAWVVFVLSGGNWAAGAVAFDNSGTDLSATSVQDALDEIAQIVDMIGT